MNYSYGNQSVCSKKKLHEHVHVYSLSTGHIYGNVVRSAQSGCNPIVVIIQGERDGGRQHKEYHSHSSAHCSCRAVALALGHCGGSCRPSQATLLVRPNGYVRPPPPCWISTSSKSSRHQGREGYHDQLAPQRLLAGPF